LNSSSLARKLAEVSRESTAFRTVLILANADGWSTNLPPYRACITTWVTGGGLRLYWQPPR
jgi:hypothetical protein